MAHKVRERCACGAEYEAEGVDAAELLQAWRSGHRLVCTLMPLTDA